MLIAESFVFSQQSLQDYVDCARRFQIRYVLRQPWPAFPADPPGAFMEHVQRGADFHRLAHQHALGLDHTRLAMAIGDPLLADWWQSYAQNPVADLPRTVRRAEVSLSAPLAGHRLAAKLDLLASDPGERLVVVDWKTTLRQLRREALARRLQTRVYCYLAVESGAAYNDGHSPDPERVEMVYWFACSGGATERFRYDTAQHRANERYVASLVREVAAQEATIWPLTTDTRRCQWCNYRSLCGRDVQAGDFDHLDVDLDPDLMELELELEQIAEIAF